MRKLFTSESVTEGHPDKLCDQVSDAVLDAYLEKDPNARVACEVLASNGLVVIGGEITSTAQVDIPAVARKVAEQIGYIRPELGLDAKACVVLNNVGTQSPDIAQGVDVALEARGGEVDEMAIGAGDQGMMFGYACDETQELMPMPIALSHNLTRRLTQLRKEGILPYLRPDGKAMVTVEYQQDEPVRVDTIVLSAQHDPDVPLERIREDLIKLAVAEVIPSRMLDENTRYFVNPTGRFVTGGPQGDAGLTGRKIIVDTYGGFARHGGGAFSGKDPTKVDRSACYAARHAALNLVAAGLAKRCEIQVSYAIGVAKPVSVRVDTFGTGVIGDDALAVALERVYDFRPAAIIRNMGLRRPIYQPTAAYGHFGRPDLDLPWEKRNLTKELLAAAKNL